MDRQPQILFVDDEQLLHGLFERLFTRHGIHVTTCTNAIQAIELLKETPYDLVVTDFMMPDMDGIELLSYIRQEHPQTKVIMITAHANVQHAVRTMQNGAIDYIPKPFSTTELVERVRACLATPAGEEAPAPEKKTRRSSARKPAVTVEYIGEHPSIQALKDMLPRISQNKAPVFIQGESGTGKEILARLIHQMSDRASGPYVTLNCANLPRELVESHLFGHRKGAFTGAIEDMTGAFERADGGTLLLDEITEIDLPIQAKLLRVLQEREFQKVGSTEVQKVDVRIIATSNRNLAEAIEEGVFREDLYHRLSVFPLSVPPLRERISDVPLLARHFVKKYCELYGLPDKTIAPELMRAFQTHPWPGNVRQLENMVQRGVLLSADRSVIEAADVLNDFFSDANLDAAVEVKRGEGARLQTIEDMERYMIIQALSETNNNQQLAAERLGISARTIRNKLKRYREQGLIS
ncbi:MAG: sigma-54-dependent Fis family transcriptional regulator [Bacteroidetes bacterium]|nr:sigma-54-dependent Fis family transcriptional regulator [Rhodothermaceae bacterium RA]RMH55107.1 MAG: sigma-54-dependent Fis family transcriptional regulator [Bacteroidota bacterium]